ncbi:MAG: hypothetical protein JO359_10085 [Candidatus Eremiobacteraeota bacterium]|nr:hypothetical protein [Candidatus Eremiobacteraeota bacterium]
MTKAPHHEFEPWTWHRFAGCRTSHARQGIMIVQLFAAVLGIAAVLVFALGTLR